LGKFSELGFSDAHLAETADGSQAVVGSRPCSDTAAPTVLLYAHYDVQPPLDEASWRTPPFQLTEVDGRWYGRGAADCKGNIVVHLAALRALGDQIPVHLKLVVEGSEEQGTGGLEDFVPKNADLLRSDVILVCDTGNAAVGRPAATVRPARLGQRHRFESKLCARKCTLACSEGLHLMHLPRLSQCWRRYAMTRANTTITGLDNKRDLDGRAVSALSSSESTPACSMAHRFWEMAVSETCCGRVPRSPFLASTVRQSRINGGHRSCCGTARLNLRIPPGIEPDLAYTSLVDHLQAVAPWVSGSQLSSRRDGEPFMAKVDGPAYEAMASAMNDAYGTPMTTLGQGGSIPLCNVFADTYPTPS
jgi:acetylornithine deacetylase/succinyl-diaminopimelate desuccinylase-like protein